MTNTENPTIVRLPLHTMNLLYRLALKTVRPGDHLTYSGPTLIRMERQLERGHRLVTSVWNLPKGGLSYDRYIIRPGKPTTYLQSNVYNVSEAVAHLLRLPNPEVSETDMIAHAHESFELSEIESYYPSDDRSLPLSLVDVG